MFASLKKLLLTFLVVMLIATACRAAGEDDKVDEAARVKRGGGYGGGGGGGGGHGHGPGKGGGASGPVYFCGYVGKGEGSGYGGYGK